MSASYAQRLTAVVPDAATRAVLLDAAARLSGSLPTKAHVPAYLARAQTATLAERPVTATTVQVENIPDQLTRERRWVGWRYERRHGKPTKVPYIATAPTREASSTDAATWSAFADALAGYRTGAVDGIGFVLGDGFAGYDFDETPDEKAWQIIRTLNSYTETSPSGLGVHVIVRGIKPGPKCRTGNHELYDHGRYFTVTGHRLSDLPPTIEDRSAELALVYTSLFGVDAPPTHGDRPDWIDASDRRGTEHLTPADLHATVEHLSDDDLIALASDAANGEKFRRLWAGDTTGYPSHSEADAALCCLLAFWTQRDAKRVDRLFRRSGLMRPKWDSRRGQSTWGATVVAKALLVPSDVYVPAVHEPLLTDVPLVQAEPEPSPPRVASPYTFVQAFGPEHFVSEWISAFSQQCDAAHEFHEAAALVALAQATPTLRARISGSAHGLRTNLYVLFVGDPGRSRKSTAKDYAVEVINRALPDTRLPEQMSHEGMIEALSDRSHGPAFWAVDEFTDMLAKMMSATFLAGLRGMLLELYAKTDYTYKRVSKRRKKGADPEEDALQVSGVNLSVIGCATPTIFQHLDNTAVGSGLLSRFAIVMPESKPPRIPQYELKTEDAIPSRLVQWLHNVAVCTKDKTVRFAPGVLERLDAAIDAPLDESTERGLMTERIGVMARKVAMLSAAGRASDAFSSKDPFMLVTLEDAEAAICVAQRWTAYAQAFESRVNETVFEVHVQRCLAVIQGRDGWVNRREVARRVHVDARMMREIEETLVMRGRIDVREDKPTTGRPGRLWRWLA